MSSIDKGVKGVARQRMLGVSVVNSNGYIKGYNLNGDQVFEIKDRYGYLSSVEAESIIRQIDEYKRKTKEEKQREKEEERKRREEEERKRLEAIEAARVNAINNFRKKVSDKKETINRLYNATLEKINSYENELKQADIFSDIKDYNLSSYNERFKAEQNKFENFKNLAKAAYENKIEAIDKVNNSLSVNASESEARKSNKSLNNISEVFNVDIDTSHTNFVSEVNALKESLQLLKKVENELLLLKINAENDNIVESLKNAIHTAPINNIDDVNKLCALINDGMNELKQNQTNEEIVKGGDEIANLLGQVKQVVTLNKNFESDSYERITYKEKINNLISDIEVRYNSLKDAEFTTCTKDEFNSVFDLIQNINNDNKQDKKTYEVLVSILEKYNEYKSQDESLASCYEDYQNKINELKKLGYDGEIEKFIPNLDNYENHQKLSLVKKLVKYDLKTTAAKANGQMMTYDAIMKVNGYIPLKMKLATETKPAGEAYYAVPGGEGFVVELVVTEDGISRGIRGIKRASTNMTTSVDRIKEVAKIIESTNEHIKLTQALLTDIDNYAKPQITNAVDYDSPNVDEIIKSNGVLNLDTDLEKKYDEIVKNANSEQVKKWATKVVEGPESIRVMDVESNTAANTSASVAQNLQVQRMKI